MPQRVTIGDRLSREGINTLTRSIPIRSIPVRIAGRGVHNADGRCTRIEAMDASSAAPSVLESRPLRRGRRTYSPMKDDGVKSHNI